MIHGLALVRAVHATISLPIYKHARALGSAPASRGEPASSTSRRLGRKLEASRPPKTRVLVFFASIARIYKVRGHSEE
jgi:hypothetical protein